jgi:hypothetical protein
MDVIKTDLSKLTKSDSLVKKNVVFVMPFINEVECNRALDILEARSAYSDAVIVAVHDTDRVGFISVANTVYRRTRSEYFGYLASDVFPSHAIVFKD